ncbi:ComEC/Rec2 family competence protein [Jannaschia pohangensis]|uniref:Competence protein ComEC n=1 Tax=Jannaschia pohangensis TaxID=390807 RepID=A0A1I3GKX0_9RHOB|nr:ComEC/Rec2 family competence protein [Jannaschia pohangensis]SFI24145.1 competence protein ComEC [Jannaschia pohangensis]
MHPSDVAPPAPPSLWLRAVELCHGLRGHRLPWAALAFGTGVGLYFALPVEPGPGTVAALSASALALVLLGWLTRASVGLLALMAAVVLAGVLVAQFRTQMVAGPVLSFRYYGAVEGRIVMIDRSASGAPRLTLDQVRLDRFAPDETPRRVRISLQSDSAIPKPGTRVMTTAHLSPPSGPTEPGGFDFQRHAFFLQLGAVGYSRVPLLRAEAPTPSLAMWVEQVRKFIGDGLRARMPGQVGEVAAAITTGDRAGLSDDVTVDLRASNLAHLLAISGLHMGLLVGFVFWSVRGGLALFPRIALVHPTRAWAAATALPFATAYLFLSGGSVATQRAFVMAAVMLGAILIGRRALSIRSVAMAAILILLWHPESLVGPGFQMSFAATGALVLAFGAIARSDRAHWMRGWRGAVMALLVSSIVAGLATAPIAALHFNRLGQFGVLANVLAVPMMGILVMPLLLVGLLLWPIGLETIPLKVAGWGIEWILWVADFVAELPGAVTTVPAPVWQVLPLLGLALGVLGAARSHVGRGIGVAVMGAAFVVWAQSDRPDLLISDDGRLIGVATPEGRWLNRDSGVGYVAGAWLENDGDPGSQPLAAARDQLWPVAWPPIHAAATPGQAERAVEACRRAPGLLILPDKLGAPVPSCDVYDIDRLRQTGAVAIRFSDMGPQVVTAREMQGQRPWSTP